MEKKRFEKIKRFCVKYCKKGMFNFEIKILTDSQTQKDK